MLSLKGKVIGRHKYLNTGLSVKISEIFIVD